MHKASKTQKRRSFLAIRLSADEIGLLHDLAAKHGVGISTFTRSLILRAAAEDKSVGAKPVSAEQIAAALKKAGIKVVERSIPARESRSAAITR